MCLLNPLYHHNDNEKEVECDHYDNHNTNNIGYDNDNDINNINSSDKNKIISTDVVKKL